MRHEMAAIRDSNPHRCVPPIPMIRSSRWQELGHNDPRMPQAFVIEFSAGLFDGSAIERLGIVLPAELQRSVPRRQAEFLMGRLAARQAVERLGLPASIPGIGASREPLWQPGVTGSITHTDDVASAIAVSSSSVQGVGIDIQKVIEGDASDAVRELAIGAGEQALLRSQGHLLAADMLLTIAFSAKESFFKGVFAAVGRYFEFSDVRVGRLDVAAGQLELTLQETLCPVLTRDQSFAACFKMLSPDTVVTSFVW